MLIVSEARALARARSAKRALPHGRASDTFCSRSIKTLPILLIGFALILLQATTALAQQPTQNSQNATVTVTFAPGHPANRFIPTHALGAGVDGHSTGETVRQLSPANITAMLSA